jgi:hypothetical protein
MIYAPGHFAFTAGANVINLGSAAQSNVKLIATVERVSPNPAPLWKDSAVIGNMPALGTSGDTSFDGGILSKFDLVQAVPGPYPTDRRGRYRLTYKVSQSNVDALPDDNSMAFDFYVTDNAWSRTRLKPDSNFKPITTSGNTRAASSTGERTIKWGQILQTTDYTAQLDSVMYGNSTGGTDKLAGIETAVEVYEWVDADTNGGVSDGEITLLGASSRLYQSENQQSKFFTDGVSDVNSGAQGVKLEANKTYLVLYANTGSTAVFLNCDNVNFSHFFAVDPNNRATAINLAPNWYYGFTGQNTTPAFRVVLSEIVPTTVKPRLSNTIDLRLFPNPATDHVQVNVSDAIATGKATIQIMDLAGRLVAEETHSLQSGTSSYKLSTAALQGGIYNVRVSTPRGSKVQKLVIAR